MSGYLDTVKSSKNYNNYKLTADKVIQILSEVRNERTKSRRRWIWELMQNAKDVPNIYGGVTIRITLRPDKFIFSHNGNPFRVENITGLIQQVSSGKPSNSSDKRITGKFGTGFITTHLLSDVVRVTGIVEQEGLPPKHFELTLDRSAETSEELILIIEKELEKIEKIEDEDIFPTIHRYHLLRTEGNFDTTFTYDLDDEDSRSAAIAGVDDLATTLPQTLFFVDELKKVIVQNEITGQEITYEQFETSNIGNICFPWIKETVNSTVRFLHYIHFKDDMVSLAIPVSNHSEKELESFKSSPVLFRDFPLIGTEKFHFPFIINGLGFFPTEKRDSILLTDTTSKSVITNREILLHANEKAKLLVEWLVSNDAKNLSFIARSEVPSLLVEKEVKEWYKINIQQPYRQYLINQYIVETSHEKVKLKDAIIPKITGSQKENERFWDILRSYYGEHIMCRKAHLCHWQDNIGNISEIETWGHSIYYTIENLLEEIQSKETLDALSINHGNESGIEWLNKVYQFLLDNKLNEFFNKYKITPTISGKFKSFKEKLFIETEEKIPNEFISILSKISSDNWNDLIIHRDLIPINSSHATKTVKDISIEINKIITHEEKNQYGQMQRSFLNNNDAHCSLLDIIRVSAANAVESFQLELFGYAKKFFNYECEVIIRPYASDFNFSPAKRQLIKLMNLKIEASRSLDLLNVNNPTKWLLGYLLLLQENSEFKSFLELGKIVPNRKNVLCEFKGGIFSYGTEETPLHDDLIEVLLELNHNEDWNDVLVHDSFRKLNVLPRKLDELAVKIQDYLEKFRLENSLSSKSGAILKLIKWCESHKIEAQKYFGSFINQKDKIFVSISLDDTSVGSNIVKLLANKEKLDSLVSLADSGISLKKLSEIVEIAKSVGIETIKNLAQKLKDEQDDFEFKKQIGFAIEQSFIDAFASLALPYTIIYQGIGSHDITIVNPDNQKKFFIEIKSISPAGKNKDVKLSLSQARKAVEQVQDKNYAISFLTRPSNWIAASVDFIKNNLITQLNPGLFLGPAIEKDTVFQGLINDTREVDLIFENTERKIQISEQIWTQDSITFYELVSAINQYLS